MAYKFVPTKICSGQYVHRILIMLLEEASRKQKKEGQSQFQLMVVGGMFQGWLIRGINHNKMGNQAWSRELKKVSSTKCKIYQTPHVLTEELRWKGSPFIYVLHIPKMLNTWRSTNREVHWDISHQLSRTSI